MGKYVGKCETCVFRHKDLCELWPGIVVEALDVCDFYEEKGEDE